VATSTKLSLTGSVSLGAGVMIGAGIFALVGQVAGFAGDWFPIAFLLGAVVAGVSSYAYIRYSSVNPSSGGIAMLLKDAYGPGVAAGSFSLFMYVSMVVAESLLARTFGTYLLTPFGLNDSVILVPALGVLAIAAATIVNLIGNRVVEGSATVTAIIKVAGIALLAIAGLIGAASSSDGLFAHTASRPSDLLGVLAGATLCVLAYKGFTTITNQGDDIRDPERNIGRSIAISIALCTVIYLLITAAVQSTIGADGAVEARDFSLAKAAEPLFGQWGVGLNVAVAVVATLSGLLASLYSVSRLLAMLQKMGQALSLPARIVHQPLLITATLAIIVTVFLDLSQIASMGVLLYLSMDIAVQWGTIRHLREKVSVRWWIPALAILLDLIVVIPFIVVKVQSDLLTIVVAVAIAGCLVGSQLLATWLSARSHTGEHGV
jgi:amino acid transporter